MRVRRPRDGRQGLFLHLLQDLVRTALLNQLIVAAGLLQTDPGEEEDQEEHTGDWDVVRLEQDVEELIESIHVLHGICVTTPVRDVNENKCLRYSSFLGTERRSFGREHV